MEKLVFVSGNEGKSILVKEKFEKMGIRIDFYTYDCDELDVNDIEKILRDKAVKAYEIVGKPCFVTDSGFYIDNYPNNPGYPGAFAKRSGISSNVEQLLIDMKNIANRSCRFIDCLSFYDGEKFYNFKGISEGTLSYNKRGEYSKKYKSDLWYVFIPEDYDKTLAEMTDEERLARDNNSVSATLQFANWYKEEYLLNKRYILKNN